MPSENNKAKQPKESEPEMQPHCGVIMPISGVTGSDVYTAVHWGDVLRLIQQSAQIAGFTCDIVSANGPNDVIHGTIVTNIYESPVVVCDVSNRNPNVMLELGLRLASKLPTIVIFYGEGNYPFDLSNIRYIRYRTDMRYYDTEKFKQELAEKIKDVYQSNKDGKYKSFLDNFKNVNFDLDSIGTETETLKEFMERMNDSMDRMNNKLNIIERPRSPNVVTPPSVFTSHSTGDSAQLTQKVRNAINSYVSEYNIISLSPNEMEKLFEFLAQHFPNVVYSPNMRSLIDSEVKKAVYRNRDNAVNTDQ